MTVEMADVNPQFSRLSLDGKSADVHSVPSVPSRESVRSASSMSYADQDNAYLSELLSYSLDRLNKEPQLLREDQDCTRRQMQDCAASHHLAFVEAANCLGSVRNHLSSMNTHLKGLQENLPALEESCAVFTDRAGVMVEKRNRHKQLQSHHPQLLELLEVPQLMDTCVRNANYDEALDLEAFVSKLSFLHPELTVVADLQNEVKEISNSMLEQLLKRLSGSIQLPECLRVIGYLRRLSVFTEPQLRLRFLQCREEWLVGLVDELDKENPYDYLKRLTDTHRLHLFDIVMQYKAIFSDDAPSSAESSEAQILTSWAQHRVCLYLDALEEHLPMIKEGGSLSSVLEHSMYCGMSLGRVGLDFRGLLLRAFESCMASLFSTTLSGALESFHMALERHKWMNMPTIPYNQIRRSVSKGSTAGAAVEDAEDKPKASDSAEDMSPPQVLMEHAPLAAFVNGILLSFNELRHCAPLALRAPVAQSLQDALRVVSSTMAHFHATRVLPEAEASIFEAACCIVSEVVAPYLVSCFGQLYPGSSGQLDTVAALEPLQEIIGQAKARAAKAAAAAAPAKVKKTKTVKVSNGLKSSKTEGSVAPRVDEEPSKELPT